MSFKIIPQNNNSFLIKVKNLSKDFQRGIRQAFFLAGKDFKATANEEIKRKKTGRAYIVYRGKQRVKINAGAPLDYPANRTGANRRSLDFKVNNGSELEFGAGMKYSPFLEKGTKKMVKRPFLQPSVKKNEQKLRGHLQKEIGKSLGKI
jgi:HK97 gp10 family phage protein